jgi:hypothetical protein
MAYEQISPAFPINGFWTRTVTVKGVYDTQLRALFGATDITSRATWAASDTVTFDVSKVTDQQGVFQPLTVVQSNGLDTQTVPILHGIMPVR